VAELRLDSGFVLRTEETEASPLDTTRAKRITCTFNYEAGEAAQEIALAVISRANRGEKEAKFVIKIRGSNMPRTDQDQAVAELRHYLDKMFGSEKEERVDSDRNKKANFAVVNVREILDKVASLPVETWNYLTQNPAIRHIGPMAQDFHTAFGLGSDDTHINMVDANGVTLAAIQGLYQLVDERNLDLCAIEARIMALEAGILGEDPKDLLDYGTK